VRILPGAPRNQQVTGHIPSRSAFFTKPSPRFRARSCVPDRREASEGSIRSKGTMYFVLHPHGLNMSGRWVGLGYAENFA
jgi:hypothetical protein